jgi:hypothetical protein
MGGWDKIVALAIAAAVTSGCGSSPKPETAAPAKVERPRDTAQIAEEISGGKVGALLYMDRVRSSPLGDKLDDAFRWRAWWEGSGVDPQRDVERVFGSAPSLEHPERGIWVTELNIPLAKLKQGLDVMFEKKRLKGGWIEGARMPEAKIEMRDGSTRLVALVEPRWAVLLPEDREKDLSRFTTSGGFPDPIGAEALVMFAFDPSKTLHNGRYASFDVPDTLAAGVATITLTVDGGAEIGIDALSPNAEQAKKDAATLTKILDDATSIKVSALRVHFVDPIVFNADGEHVRGRRTVPASEIDGILAFTRPRKKALSANEPAPTEKTTP